MKRSKLDLVMTHQSPLYSDITSYFNWYTYSQYTKKNCYKRLNINSCRLKILIIEIFPLNASIFRGRGRLQRESNNSFSRLTSQYIYNTQTESHQTISSWSPKSYWLTCESNSSPSLSQRNINTSNSDVWKPYLPLNQCPLCPSYHKLTTTHVPAPIPFR